VTNTQMSYLFISLITKSNASTQTKNNNNNNRTCLKLLFSFLISTIIIISIFLLKEPREGERFQCVISYLNILVFTFSVTYLFTQSYSSRQFITYILYQLIMQRVLSGFLTNE